VIAVTDALGHTTHYAYDAAGNRIQAVETVIPAPGGGGQASAPGGERVVAAVDPGGGPAAEQTGPRLSGLFAPLLGPPPPIVRERGDYRAAFDEEGLRFFPLRRLLGEAGYHVAYRLTVVRQGQDVILHPGRERPEALGADLVRYARGASFFEEYALAAGGVEQRFIFTAPLPGAGDLVIEGNLTTNLRREWDGRSGEVVFFVPGTDEVAATGAGRRCW